MQVLIIEDEPYAQNELKRLLAQTGRQLEIAGCIDSVEDAVEWLQSNPLPDLIFVDIQLADGLGFDIFRKVKVTAPVIFTTAYDAYAIQAFKVNSIDYLLKPIKLEELREAFAKLDEVSRQYASVSGDAEIARFEKLLKSFRSDYKTRFMVKLGEQYKYVETSDIAYFHAEDNEVVMITHANRKFIIDHSLDMLTEMLDPGIFFRISRGYIVNIRAVTKVSKYFNSRLVLELSPQADEKVLISRAKVQGFLEWMDR